MLWSNMVIELWFLAWIMNWLNGLILIWWLHGYGFKSWRAYIKLYIFGIFGFDFNLERWKGNPSGMENSLKELVNDIKLH